MYNRGRRGGYNPYSSRGGPQYSGRGQGRWMNVAHGRGRANNFHSRGGISMQNKFGNRGGISMHPNSRGRGGIMPNTHTKYIPASPIQDTDELWRAKLKEFRFSTGIIENFQELGYNHLSIFPSLTDEMLLEAGLKKGNLLKWRQVYPVMTPLNLDSNNSKVKFNSRTADYSRSKTAYYNPQDPPTVISAIEATSLTAEHLKIGMLVAINLGRHGRYKGELTVITPAEITVRTFAGGTLNLPRQRLDNGATITELEKSDADYIQAHEKLMLGDTYIKDQMNQKIEKYTQIPIKLQKRIEQPNLPPQINFCQSISGPYAHFIKGSHVWCYNTSTKKVADGHVKSSNPFRVEIGYGKKKILIPKNKMPHMIFSQPFAPGDHVKCLHRKTKKKSDGLVVGVRPLSICVYVNRHPVPIPEKNLKHLDIEHKDRKKQARAVAEMKGEEFNSAEFVDEGEFEDFVDGMDVEDDTEYDFEEGLDYNLDDMLTDSNNNGNYSPRAQSASDMNDFFDATTKDEPVNVEQNDFDDFFGGMTQNSKNNNTKQDDFGGFF